MTMQTFTPLEYLKIDVASSFGLDKENWDTRIQWFDENEEQLLEIANLNNRRTKSNELMKQAEEPALFYAAVIAYDQALKGMAIRHPVSIDATASGAQILAILAGCEKSARLCNVVDTINRRDFYTMIFNGMKEFLLTLVQDGTLQSMPELTRSQCKQAIMPWFFGSLREPIKAFGEGVILDTFYSVMEEMAPGIVELRNGLLGMWNSEVEVISWTLPDNYHVHIKVMGEVEQPFSFMGTEGVIKKKIQMPQEKGRSIPANVVHSIDAFIVRELLRRCNFDKAKIDRLILMMNSGARWSRERLRAKDELVITLWRQYKKTGFFSARILELLDEKNIDIIGDEGRKLVSSLLVSMQREPFPVITVHDCFRVHPNNADQLRRTYNRILEEIARSNMLASMLTEISGEEVKGRMGVDLSEKIAQTNYALS